MGERTRYRDLIDTSKEGGFGTGSVWMLFAECMDCGMSVRRASDICGIGFRKGLGMKRGLVRMERERAGCRIRRYRIQHPRRFTSVRP